MALFSAKFLSSPLWTARLPAAKMAEGDNPPSKDTLAMRQFTHPAHHVIQLAGTLLTVLVDDWRYISLCLRSPAALAVENLFRIALTVLALVRLASGPRHRATCNPDPLASSGIPTVLALDITSRTSTDSCGPASAHPPDGLWQPNVGRGAHRQRTAPQAWTACIPAHRTHVYAQATGPWSA
jgi:hypothetical protein